MNRRGINANANPLNSQSVVMDDANSWKGVNVNDNPSIMGGGGNNPNLNPSDGSNQPFGQAQLGYGGGSGTPYSQATGQNSPAGQNQPSLVFPNTNPNPGSNTPQYTSSPAPSGSSTPGPVVGQQNMSGPYPQPNNSGNFNGPVGGPFGSPSSGMGQFSRPGSTSTPFSSGGPGGGGGGGGGPGGPGGGGVGGHFGGPGQGVFNVGGGGAGGAGGQFNSLPPGAAGGAFGHGGGGGGGGGGPGGGHPMMGGGGGPPPQMERIDPGFRRHNSYFSHTEHRVFEMNKRLQQRTEDSDNCWWDSFTTEFFEDDAKLTVLFCLEDGPKRYTIGRTLIPRFFRSIFEGGVSDLYFQLKHAKESFHNTLITLDCDQCTVITQHGKPFFTKVCADARLILEFLYDDYMRIKSWHMTIKGHRELIPRSVIGTQLPSDPMILEQITKNITRAGITNSTLNYLRLCVILEPMQELMSRHKAYALSPRDCLKTTLFQKWQRMVAPPGKKDPQRPANKRRKRKGSNSGGGAGGGGGGAGGGGGGAGNANTPPVSNQKRSPSGPNFSLSSQDVMVVGEPTLMGGEFGEEDERLITRLENTQYDGTNAMDHDNHTGGGGGGGAGGVGGGGAFGHSDSPISGANPWNMDRSGPLPSSPGGGGGGGGGAGSIVPNNTNLADIDKKSPIVSQ